MQLDTSYLNKTPNKTLRADLDTPGKPERVVWHETAGYGALGWNLNPVAKSSYNYLIARNGKVYHYVNEKTYAAWHAGIRSTWGKLRNGELNVWTIGVELEGPNDGTPITAAQRESAILLAIYLHQTHGIPLTNEYHQEHVQVSPGYKTDGAGYDAAVIIAEAAKRMGQSVPVEHRVIGVKPSITFAQFKGALARHAAPINAVEQGRVYQLCADLDIDPAFVVAVWKHEGGSPLGSSPLQAQTKCPFNIKGALTPQWPTVAYRGTQWAAFESWQLGLMQSIIYLKQVYGATKRATVEAIIPVFAPESDGNNPAAYIASVITDMEYMRTH